MKPFGKGKCGYHKNRNNEGASRKIIISSITFWVKLQLLLGPFFIYPYPPIPHSQKTCLKRMANDNLSFGLGRPLRDCMHKHIVKKCTTMIETGFSETKTTLLSCVYSFPENFFMYRYENITSYPCGCCEFKIV